MRILALVLLIGSACTWAQDPHQHTLPAPSPYAVQPDSPVRGLSVQEVDDLLNGRGMGLARMAEMHSYPGPKHVLELKEKLDLSPAQVQKTTAIFQDMDTAARRLGREIIDREKKLSEAFAGGGITEGDLRAQSEALGTRYGQLRALHLRAHLQVRALLSAVQIARYNELRGYQTPAAHPGHQ